MRSVTFSLIILVLGTIPTFSQANSVEKLFKWNFDFSLGYLIGGPNHDLKLAIIDAGPSPDWNNSELKEENKYSWSIEARRKVNSNLSFAICSNRSQFDLNLSPWQLTLSAFTISTISPIVIYTYRDFISIGSGPSLNVISYEWNTGPYDDEEFYKFNLLVKSSLKFPGKSRFYILAEIQDRILGKIERVSFSWSLPHGTRKYYNADVNFHNLYFGFGVGIRL